LHARNPEIIHLASLIGRTPDALAMKLTNFASFDPAIINSGRKGLRGASNLDRAIWEEFRNNWDDLVVECVILKNNLAVEKGKPYEVRSENIDDDNEDYIGETRQIIIAQRIRQQFFRQSVLSSYSRGCCMSGLRDQRLLVASHIKPWSKDKMNRLNPSNGLCLSAIHDKAFDRGLISLTNDFRVIISQQLIIQQGEGFIDKVFLCLNDMRIGLPDRFLPPLEFIKYHRDHVFLG
jgi:predicted restriction endonuclease